VAPATPPTAETSSFPNLDTINLDNIDLSTASDISSIPEKIGYLHEIGINYGWGPTSMIQWTLEHIHIYAGLPWWGAIAATAVALRLITFPFYLKASDMQARQAALSSILKPITQRMSECQRAGDNEGVMMAMRQMGAVRKRAGISWSGQLTPIVMQGVLGFCAFRLIRVMCTMPVPGFLDGGFLWLKDLTASDPFLIMPLVMAASVHALVRMGGETGTMNPELQTPQMKLMMRYLLPGFIFMIMGWQPGALCVWFAASGAIGMAQGLLLQRPEVRKFVGIAPLYKPTKEEAAGSGFQTMMESLRPADPKSNTKGRASSFSKYSEAETGKNAAFMRPAYQAPNLNRGSSTLGRQSNVIDVKGSSKSEGDMTSPATPKSSNAGFGIGSMVKGVTDKVKGLTSLGEEQIRTRRMQQARDAKKKAADSYEERFQSRGRR